MFYDDDDNDDRGDVEDVRFDDRDVRYKILLHWNQCAVVSAHQTGNTKEALD